MFTVQSMALGRPDKQPEKEAIHSGHFMVSHFEAEAQDDEDELAIPLPEAPENVAAVLDMAPVKPLFSELVVLDANRRPTSMKMMMKSSQQQLTIDTSLSKLFQCMSLAYRQKLTSPKWNRFRGIRLRWKDKIRLNNVIWRCWHMQFIKNQNTLICQFASPLDVNTHNKPEAVVLEGKYWKRKLAAVTAEYKKWRMFYRQQALGHMSKDSLENQCEMDVFAWNSECSDNNMMVDEDYMGLISDTLFSTITNQPFVFPDSREIAKAGLADFIQPSLGPLQPNLDDYMDTTLEPFQDFISGKLPTVPEEQQANENAIYKQQQLGWCYDLDLITGSGGMPMMEPYQNADVQPVVLGKQSPVQIQDTRQQQQPPPPPPPGYGADNVIMQSPVVDAFLSRQQQPPPPPPPPYQTAVVAAVISKNTPNKQIMKSAGPPGLMKMGPRPQPPIYDKQQLEVYQNYSAGMAPVINTIRADQQQQQQQQISADFKPLTPQEQNASSSSSTSSSTGASAATQGYKFPPPTTLVPPNVKFTSQQKEDKRLSRGRQRSRSTTREPMKRPPLLSAISDPQLVPPAPMNSVLLTQLLTNSADGRNIFSAATTNQQQAAAVLHEQQQQQHAGAGNLRVKEENAPISILPQPTPTTLIITTPISMNPAIQQPPMSAGAADPLMHNPTSPILDGGLNSPTSSQGSMGSPNRGEKSRVGHIHAEQKRRYNIKNGFDMIHSLIPHLNQNPNAKLSKAAMLQKGAEYIRQLRTERNQLKEEMDSLRQQIETLNTSISNCQSLLPATGAPVSRRRDSKMQEMFDEYVRTRTSENWKFWIFSLLFRPLLVSFNNFVTTSSLDDLYRSTLIWIEQHCTLVDLRPVVLNSLRYLCTKTDILSEPEKLPDEARQAVLHQGGQK